MTGVVLCLVLAVAMVVVIATGNLIGVANAGHERAGLFGAGPLRRRLETDALTGLLHGEEAETARNALCLVVADLDRLAFAGVPLAACTPTRSDRRWDLVFRDGTRLRVEVGDPRALARAAARAAKEPVVVTHVHPHADRAVVALGSPRHRPLRVALRS